jgi:hypothetical protein
LESNPFFKKFSPKNKNGASKLVQEALGSPENEALYNTGKN